MERVYICIDDNAGCTEYNRITATCSIGPNLYLAKIALDIISKHVDDHIGILTEESYHQHLRARRPISDFWKINVGITNRLERNGIITMREITLCNEKILYKMFDINIQILIDHAWGREAATIAGIKTTVRMGGTHKTALDN